MLLFELAIALDMRSSDLVDLAREAGIGSFQAGSDLDASQVAALRARVGAGAPGGVASPGAAPVSGGPPPAGLPPMGPATWGPPSSAVDDAPRAPSHWGPPPGVGAAAVPSAPPVATPAPLPAAPAGTGAPVPPATWGPSSSQDAPVPPAAWAPTPSHDAPVTPATPAAPEPAMWGAPTAIGPNGMGAPSATPTPPPSSGFSKGQLAAIGVAVALAVGLFAFMVVNSGHERSDEAGAEVEADRDPSGGGAPSDQAGGADEPADVDAFCRGGRGIMPIELRMAGASAANDIADLQQVIRDGQGRWSESVDEMLAGAPPSLVDDIETYRTGYLAYFDDIEASSSLTDLQGRVDRASVEDSILAGRQINVAITEQCS